MKQKAKAKKKLEKAWCYFYATIACNIISITILGFVIFITYAMTTLISQVNAVQKYHNDCQYINDKKALPETSEVHMAVLQK